MAGGQQGHGGRPRRCGGMRRTRRRGCRVRPPADRQGCPTSTGRAASPPRQRPRAPSPAAPPSAPSSPSADLRLLLHGGPGDRGQHHQLFRGHVGGHALRQDQVADADAGTDGQTGDVDLQVGRDPARRGVDRQGGEQLLDDALLLLHRPGLAYQHDRHLGRDDLVAAHDLEVDMHDGVADRVALHGAGQGQVGLRPHLDGEQLVEAGLARQGVAQVTAVHRNRHAVGAVAVDARRGSGRRPAAAATRPTRSCDRVRQSG